MTDRIWVTWERQRRNRTLSAQAAVPLFELRFAGPRIVRYPVLTWRTVLLFVRASPRVIFAQAPSILLGLWAVVYGKLFGRIVIIDAHHAGIFPVGGHNRALNALARTILRSASLVIVTNESMKQHVERVIGAKAVIVPDPLPVFSPRERRDEEATRETGAPADLPAHAAGGTFGLTVVCTWGYDEPFMKLIEAARLLAGEPIRLYITGNHRGHLEATSVPANVTLTGFLAEEEYVDLLSRSDAVVVLTCLHDCLNCGAYEAVALEKPMLLFDSKELRKYFSKGAVHTDNRPEDIADKILSLRKEHQRHASDVRELKSRLAREWPAYLQNLEAAVAALEGGR
jgi:glycosyltransferase involved in cell wall biosynthesis